VSENVGRANPDLARQREEVAEQREELGRTIAQLADRVDVPARAREQSARLRARLSEAGPELILGAVALVSTVVSVVAFASWYRRPRTAPPRPR
jgi:hypothetical protein